jgi:hypothetical protein
VFIQFVCDDAPDAPVPGEAYTFGRLKAAQALGDYQSLAARQRRLLRVNLGTTVDQGLALTLAAVLARPKPAAKKSKPKHKKAVRGRKPA